MPSIILPNDRIEHTETPLFFLGGPITGAPLWQDKAIEILISQKPDITIANPRKIPDSRHKHLRVYGKENFSRQRKWEWYYLKKAGKESERGSIIFWLPGEVQHRCEKAYGAMSRVELGQWMTRYRFDSSIRLSMGTDGKFSEWDTILYDLREEYEINLPIFDTAIP